MFLACHISMKFIKPPEGLDVLDAVFFSGTTLLGIGVWGHFGSFFLGLLVIGAIITLLGVIGLFRE
jgi:hypothetical protein